MQELQWTDRHKALRALRVMLHLVRDHLPAEEECTSICAGCLC
jgi:uncharacterized protein (DUF2267 family)